MKKSLIALLVATLPAAAFADVTIYGKIKGGVEYVDNGSTKQTNVEDLGSRIGFKGSEDLGNGLKTIWQVESGFDIDGSNSQNRGTFASRESFIGLQSGFGTVRLGYVSNFLDSDMGTVDSWEYKSDALGLGIFTRDATRLKNSVRYDLPAVVPGLTAAIQYGTKEDKSTGSQDRETSVIGLGYENSGFFGKYAYTHQSKASSGFNTPVSILGVNTTVYTQTSYQANDKHRLEVGYNANNLFVGLGYQQEKGGYDIIGSSWGGLVGSVPAGFKITDQVKTQEYALTAAYTFGAITPKFTYAHGNNVKVNGVSQDNTKYDQYVLGADYAVSKRTTFGAQYGQIAVKGDGNKDLKAFGLNMVHKF
ncbi:porin [Chromobacterium violaceum]|uniref:porin n=1 Tax=Chromobacterium violaceum TaxID=536 RepID=UPI0009DB48D7|nr:porin [Chromobacterium violaceum]OQS48580.1 porin [Chromobacterium violaceum]OQS52086.1 porin [Chromobacterium violaceum]QRO33010.1 porin [Chromobacterium violaceum]QRQ17189.1 porin [Chromobacterium violaceum]